MSNTDDMAEIELLVERAKLLLRGHPGGIQGAVLVELLALWLAGHPPAARERVLAMHVQVVRKFLPIAVRELFGGSGHPSGGDK